MNVPGTTGTKLTVRVPDNACTGKLSITTSGGTSTSAKDFTVAAGVFTVAPAAGTMLRATNLLFFTGVRLNEVSSVSIAGIEMEQLQANASGTTLNCVVPNSVNALAIKGLTKGKLIISSNSFLPFPCFYSVLGQYSLVGAPVFTSRFTRPSATDRILQVNGLNLYGAQALMSGFSARIGVVNAAGTEAIFDIPAAAVPPIRIVTPSGEFSIGSFRPLPGDPDYDPALDADEASSAFARGAFASVGPLGLYPNPAHERVAVTFGAEAAAGVTIQVLDAVGRVVSSLPADPTGTTALDLRQWPLGVYTVRAGGAVQRLVVE